MAARRTAVDLPALIKPQLATLVDGPPANSEDFIYEIKFDGYRMLTRVEGKSIKLFTRNGNDWTSKLEPLRLALAKSKLPDGWYDGEMVVLAPNGLPDFNALQNAIDNLHTADITYFLFDAPFLGGEDLREASVITRRQRLSAALEYAQPSIRFSEAFAGGVRDITVSACKLGPKNRVGKIFIDYLRNGWGATTVSAWSARARDGMGISVPVRWDELSGLTGGAQWTIRDVHDRLDDGNSPWDGYDRAGKSISSAMKRLG